MDRARPVVRQNTKIIFEGSQVCCPRRALGHRQPSYVLYETCEMLESAQNVYI